MLNEWRLLQLGAASPEELREKLRPSLGALLALDAKAEAVPLEEQLAVLTLVAGIGDADVQLVSRALRKSPDECATMLQQFVTSGLLRVVATPAGPRYRLGPAGIDVLGDEGASAVRRTAERAGVSGSGPASQMAMSRREHALEL